MPDFEFDLLMLKDAERFVLQAYLAAELVVAAGHQTKSQAVGEQVERRTRWVPRIREIDNVPEDRLAPIHGRLIAWGYLQFQLQGRDTGVVYHVTPEGRGVLSAAVENATAEEPVLRSA